MCKLAAKHGYGRVTHKCHLKGDPIMSTPADALGTSARSGTDILLERPCSAPAGSSGFEAAAPTYWMATDETPR